MIGKPDKGKKPVVSDRSGNHDSKPAQRISEHTARGGQSKRPPLVVASETKNKPATSGGKRSTTGQKAGGKDTSPGFGGAPRTK